MMASPCSLHTAPIRTGRSKWLAALTCLAILSPAAIAQSGSHSLESMVRSALINHPSIIGASARQEAATYSLDAAKSGRLPSLAVGLGRADDGSRANSIAVTQPLWTGGRITGEIAGGEYRVSAAEAGLREAELQLSEQVVQLGLELVRYRTLVAIATDNLAAHEQLMQTTERRAKSGAGTESDLVLAGSRTEQARASLTQWQSAERRTAARLVAVTGESAPTLLAIGSNPLAGTKTPEDAVSAAQLFSPTVVRLKAEAEAAGSDATVAESRLWPQLGLKAEALDNTGLITQRDNRLMLTLEYQPGAGLGARDRARAASAQKRAAEIAIDRAKREVTERVSADLLEAQGLAPRITSLERVVKANKDLVASFLRQFTAGKRSWLDVLNAQNEFTSSKQALEETRFAALAASYRVALATGQFFTKDNR
jgi:adhesin transport system outer membrane protein